MSVPEGYTLNGGESNLSLDDTQPIKYVCPCHLAPIEADALEDVTVEEIEDLVNSALWINIR